MDCFQKIDVSSKLLIDLINEVLDMSKVESGQILLAEEEVNLAELVQGVWSLWCSRCSRTKPPVQHLRQRRHPRDGGQRRAAPATAGYEPAVERGKIRPEAWKRFTGNPENPIGGTDTAHYEFIVSDTGIGMKPEFLSHVFDPFERAEDVKIQAVQGTGLGPLSVKNCGTDGRHNRGGKRIREGQQIYRIGLSQSTGRKKLTTVS